MRKAPKAPPKAKPVQPSVVDPDTGEILIPWNTMQDQLKELGLL